jgi:hypothetical protein
MWQACCFSGHVEEALQRTGGKWTPMSELFVEPRALAAVLRRSAASPQTAAVGQPEAMAILMRRTTAAAEEQHRRLTIVDMTGMIHKWRFFPLSATLRKMKPANLTQECWFFIMTPGENRA